MSNRASMTHVETSSRSSNSLNYGLLDANIGIINATVRGIGQDRDLSVYVAIVIDGASHLRPALLSV